MASDTAPLASLSLTHVYYDPNDPISLLCAWLALVPQALCVVYATLVWSTREAEVCLLFAGQLACEAVNFALKRLIKESRPPGRVGHGKGYGMPSSHAQFVAFWAVALVLFTLLRHRPSRVVPRRQQQQQLRNDTDDQRPPATAAAAATPWSALERALASIVALGLAAAVAWSRVYLEYHTPRQVLVGSAAGAVSAVAWFAATGAARELGLLGWALETPPARWLRVRDLAVWEDLPQAGWEKWEGLRRAASVTNAAGGSGGGGGGGPASLKKKLK